MLLQILCQKQLFVVRMHTKSDKTMLCQNLTLNGILKMGVSRIYLKKKNK